MWCRHFCEFFGLVGPGSDFPNPVQFQVGNVEIALTVVDDVHWNADAAVGERLRLALVVETIDLACRGISRQQFAVMVERHAAHTIERRAKFLRSLEEEAQLAVAQLPDA